MNCPVVIVARVTLLAMRVTFICDLRMIPVIW